MILGVARPVAQENVAFGELKMLNFRAHLIINFISIYDFLDLHASLAKKIWHFAT